MIRLISHASVQVDTILCDPWLGGRAFNDSWELIAPAAPPDYSTIAYLWISHEHPDHFHIPSLKAMPAEFKERVTVLFQRSSDHHKMVAAFRRLGFGKVELLPHGKWVRLSEGLEVLCYQSRQIDSALAVRSPSGVVLNLNDCDFDPTDLAQLRKLVGEPDVLLNQFSLAGFDGLEEALPAVSARILDDMVAAHRALAAKVTVPFASFAYFCCEDNAFINRYANTPRAVAERFRSEGLELQVLAPGQTLGEERDALMEWDSSYRSVGLRASPSAQAVGLTEIEEAFNHRCDKIIEYHGIWARLLRPVVVKAGQLGHLKLDFAARSLSQTEDEPHLAIEPQPLHFMLKHDFGLQTLGVSGRYRLLAGKRNWMLHRAMFSMLNAGIGLSLARLLSADQLSFFWRRRADLLRQVSYTFRRASI